MAASVASASDLDINAVESFTNLESTEEVNTTISDGHRFRSGDNRVDHTGDSQRRL